MTFHECKSGSNTHLVAQNIQKKNSKTAKAITETFQMLNKSIEDRCQIALQRAQRKETEDTIFIQNNKEKIKDEKGCRD